MKNITHLPEIWLAPMGLTLRVISNSPAIIAAARTSFGRCGPPPADTPPNITLRLFEHPLPHEPPGPPVFRRQGHLLYQTTGPANTLVADVAQGAAFGYFTANIAADAPFFRWHFLELAFFQMLEARGWMGVHASALVQDGRAVLLRAPSGGGKTTLAYAGARRNFQALAEDVVWLEPGGERAWGLPWHVHLLPDARDLFPELAAYRPALQTSGEWKLEVELEAIRPGSTVTSAQVAALLFVERQPGQPTRLEPIDAAAARRRWPAAQTGLESQLPHHAAHIERLLAGPRYLLHYGNNIEAALDLIKSINQ